MWGTDKWDAKQVVTRSGLQCFKLRAKAARGEWDE